MRGFMGSLLGAVLVVVGVVGGVFVAAAALDTSAVRELETAEWTVIGFLASLAVCCAAIGALAMVGSGAPKPARRIDRSGRAPGRPIPVPGVTDEDEIRVIERQVLLAGGDTRKAVKRVTKARARVTPKPALNGAANPVRRWEPVTVPVPRTRVHATTTAAHAEAEIEAEREEPPIVETPTTAAKPEVIEEIIDDVVEREVEQAQVVKPAPGAKPVERDRSDWLTHAAACRQRVLEVADSAIETRMEELGRLRREKVYEDEFGRTNTRLWEKETAAFFNATLRPAIVSACSVVAYRAALCAMIGESRPERLDVVGAERRFAAELHERIERSLRAGTTKTGEDMWPANVMRLMPEEYERLCTRALAGSGWDVRRESPAPGIDLVATRGGRTAVVRCLLSSRTIDNAAVLGVDAAATELQADLAMVVSNATPSPGAKAAATKRGVLLLHHEKLHGFGDGPTTETITAASRSHHAGRPRATA